MRGKFVKKTIDFLVWDFLKFVHLLNIWFHVFVKIFVHKHLGCEFIDQELFNNFLDVFTTQF